MGSWLESIILYAPGFCDIFWLAMLVLFGEKKSPQTALLVLAAILGIRMFLDMEYVNMSLLYSREVVFLEIISNWTTLLIYPTICIYIKLLRGKNINLVLVLLSAMPSIFLGISSMVIFKITGIGNATVYLSDLYSGKASTLSGPVYDILYLILYKTYYILVYIGISASIICSTVTLFKNGYKPGDLCRMLFKKGSMLNINSSCILLLFIMMYAFVSTSVPRSFIIEQKIFTLVSMTVITVLHFLLFYTGTFFNGHRITLARLRHPGVTKTDSDIYLNLDINERRKNAVMNNDQQDNMMKKFISYVETEGHFADKDITIESVTKAIGTNRTYISVMVKNNLHTPFRSYINSLRIDEAKRLLVEKPDDLLEVIAAECGFANDSQFVKKFKESTGMTPREWQSHNLHR